MSYTAFKPQKQKNKHDFSVNQKTRVTPSVWKNKVESIEASMRTMVRFQNLVIHYKSTCIRTFRQNFNFIFADNCESIFMNAKWLSLVNDEQTYLDFYPLCFCVFYDPPIEFCHCCNALWDCIFPTIFFTMTKPNI